MNRSCLILIFALSCCGLAKAQRQSLLKTPSLFAYRDLQGISANVTDPAIRAYQTGLCYLHSRSLGDQAIPYLKEAVSASTGRDSLQVSSLLALGEAYMADWDYEKAFACFNNAQRIKHSLSPDTSRDLEMRLQFCQAALEQARIAPCPLPKEVHALRYYEQVSANPETLPVDTAQTAIDTLGEASEATLGTSDDHQLILIYSPDSAGYRLFTANLTANRWSAPAPVAQPINSTGWELQETITADASLLFFVSDRSGGYGGKDIYYCTKQSDCSWSKARNAGPMINSVGDDFAPFIHPEGKVLYFSSNRYKSHGGYDVFAATCLPEMRFAKAINIGYPKNPMAFDSEQLLAMHGKTIKNTSTKNLPQKKPALLTRFSDSNNNSFVLMQGSWAEATKSSKEDILLDVLPDAHTNSCTYRLSKAESFALLLPNAQRIGLLATCGEGRFLSSEIQPTDSLATMSFLLNTPRKGLEAELQNVLFEADLPTLQASSSMELNHLAALLSENPALCIQIDVIDQSNQASTMQHKLVEARASMLQQALEQGVDCKGRVRCVGRIQSKGDKSEQPRVVLKITKA